MWERDGMQFREVKKGSTNWRNPSGLRRLGLINPSR
jgi:hypothetical protein